MSQAVATKSQSDLARIEQVLLKGDLASLNEGQRLDYYRQVCETVGLNPLTKPFEYINLSGKLVLYATKGCAEQLRQTNNISIRISDRSTIEGVYVVTAAAQRPDGRVDESTGAVQIAGLKGDNLANAMMKAETKAKRRVTLSICGLNMLDDTEVETIKPGRVFADQPPVDGSDGVVHTTGKIQIQQGAYKQRHPTELSEPDLRKEIERLESVMNPSIDQLRDLDRLREALVTLQNMEPSDSAEPTEKPLCECGAAFKLSPSKGVYYCSNWQDKTQVHSRNIPKAEYEAI